MEKFFHLKERGTTVRTEIMAGITTFFAMVYILMVNAGMFANPFGDGTNVLGISYGAIYIATAISAVVGTLLIGLLANLPLAQASGMGLNAFFVYTVCVTFGLTYANALVLVLIDGIVFIILTITGLRKKIFTAIPEAVRIAILGLQNAGLVVLDSATCVNLASFNLLKENAWASIMPMLVTLLALIAIAVMSKKNVKGAVLWGILGGAVLYYLLGFTVPGFWGSISISVESPLSAFGAFFSEAFGKVFTEGFDFSAYIAANGTGSMKLLPQGDMSTDISTSKTGIWLIQKIAGTSNPIKYSIKSVESIVNT